MAEQMKTTESRYSAFTRDSILSDPRLSQLFHISEQIEALAESLPGGQQHSTSSNNVQPSIESPLAKDFSEMMSASLDAFKWDDDEEEDRKEYEALKSPEEILGEAFTELDQLNAAMVQLAPAPRYSAFSDSRMSVSTLEESTPSLTSEKEEGWSAEGEGAKEMTGGEELAWQERCMELEESLASFRDQANRIREILKEKLADLETRVEDAETRAEKAENKVRILERRLEESSWTPSEQSSRSDEIQHSLFEKEKAIRNLESEVENQRQQRLADAKQVEAKAARIKDWVTNKLRELEEQNQHLREQNAYCNEQMELLRTRLEKIQELGQECDKANSRRESAAEDSSLGSFEGDPCRSADSLTDATPGSRGSRYRNHQASSDPSSLYAQVDPKKKRRPPSAYLNRPSAERSRNPASMTASMSGLEELSMRKAGTRDSRVDSGSMDLEMPSMEISPKSPLEALDDALNAVMPNSGSLVTPTPPPRNKLNVRDSRNSLSSKIEKHKPMTLLHKKSDDESRLGGREEFTRVRASGPESMSGSSSIRTGSGDSGVSGGSQSYSHPPPLPSHKYPSWEEKLYQVASDGLSVIGAEIDSSNNNAATNQLSSGYGHDVNVPVYATVKGRASIIRSMPFTGNSSDSSDGEGDLAFSRDHSEIDDEDDYALPPDASLEPPRSRSRTRASYLESPRKTAEKTLEKSGYLTKLGGKIKSWNKRYFVLNNGVLSYWKSQHDLGRKPQGIIVLDESCRISRAEGSNTFEIATKIGGVAGKTYYLTADSQPLMEDWVRVLQNVVQRNALKLLLSQEDHKPSVQGWVVKVKHGHQKKCWCVLIGKMFIYFKTPNDQNPMGQINMRDTRVEEVEHISDSDSDELSQVDKSVPQPTLGIFPNHVQQGPTYLIFSSRAEQEKWLYQLTLVSGGDPKAGTQFEQLVQKLMEEDGNPSSSIWRHSMMTHSKEPLNTTLTTFTSESLQSEALKLFKSVQLFTSVVLDSSGIDYHVVLAQNAIQQCLDFPELQPELLSILIKQTSRHGAPTRPGSATRNGIKHPKSFLLNAANIFGNESGVSSSNHSSQSNHNDCKSNPPNTVFMQGWMLMAIAASIFVPKSSKLLWLLRTHFARNKDSKTETGKYASYCEAALEKCVRNGPRSAKPSRMEVLSILLKNPHHHSLPHAVPVHMLSGTYHVVGFDGSTTIAEFLNTLNADIGCRGIEMSGFTIFSDDPFEKNVDHCLSQSDKVCDIISRWETALREKGMGKFENKRVIRFTYRNRMFWRRSVPGETDRERILFCYQISQQIVDGRFPLNKVLAFELAALMAQIDMGDLSLERGRHSGASAGAVSEALKKFYPCRYQENIDQEEKQEMEGCLEEKWKGLAGKSSSDCVRILLTCTRKWQFFGSTLFDVVSEASGVKVWLAVNEEGLAILDHNSMQVTQRFSYTNFVTFGGCQEDFMLVVSSPDVNDDDSTLKMLFRTSKPKILEITLLIADYMNMMGQRLPKTSQTSSRVHSRSVSRSRLTSSTLTAISSAPNTPRLNSKDEKSSLVRSGSTSNSNRHHQSRQKLDTSFG